MAKYSIKKAAKGRNLFDLSQNHITTTDFGQLQVSSFLPVMPDDKITINMAAEARFAPMVVPTFMDVSLYTRAFFVPMSAIWKAFENFYTDKQDASVLKQLPTITNSALVEWLCIDSSLLYGVIEGTACDVIFSFHGNLTSYNFTEEGRIFYKLLLSLGYSLNFDSNDDTEFSLLPLFAFARVVYDYVYPSQYVDSLALRSFFEIGTKDAFNSFSPTDFLDKLKDLLVMPYKQDYFTAAWKNYNAPGSAVQSITLDSPDNSLDTIESQSNTVQLNERGSNFSQFGLNVLSRLYDYVTRNNLVGTRYVDQIFAKFGIGSRKSDKDMSQFIGQHVQPIKVVDVTAMSASENQALGDLGGKSYTQGNGNLCQYESNEFGYIICLSYLLPSIGYYQGRKRWITSVHSRFDWPTPEFDMQLRAIRNDELFADFTQGDFSTAYGGNPSGRFGFAPNYSEWKKGEDFLTGDFRLRSKAKNLDSYHLFRDLRTPSPEHPLALNSEFLFCRQHEFDKIFAQSYVLCDALGWRTGIDAEPYFFSNLQCLTLDGLPVFIKWNTVSQGTIYGLIVRDKDSDNPPTIYWSATVEVFGWFGVNASDFTTFKLIEFTGNNSYFNFDLGSKEIYISNSSSEVYSLSSTMTANQFREFIYLWIDDTYVRNGDVLFEAYSDYIDHAYLKYRFDIKAQRALVPISQEFMIQDGGDLLNVDALGNRIN